MPRDAGHLANVSVRSWRESYSGILPDRLLSDLEWSTRRRRFAAKLTQPRPNSAIYCVEQMGGGVIGYGSCGPKRSGPALYRGEFHEIYILRRYQRLGIGGHLMRMMAGWLQSRDQEPAIVWVLDANRAARAFYERIGGVPVGEANIQLEGVRLKEIAYGWDTVDPIVLSGASPVRLTI